MVVLINVLFFFIDFSNVFILFADKGDVFGWGNSEYAQLNLNGGIQQINVPIQIKMLNKCGKIIDIAVSGSACIVLNGLSWFAYAF